MSHDGATLTARERATLVKEIGARSLAEVARMLGVKPRAVSNAVSNAARAGTVAMVRAALPKLTGKA